MVVFPWGEFHSVTAYAQALRDQLRNEVNTEDWTKAQETKDKLNTFVMERKKSLTPGMETSAAIQTAEPEVKPLGEVLKAAGRRALGGGVAGALAMVVQVGDVFQGEEEVFGSLIGVEFTRSCEMNICIKGDCGRGCGRCGREKLMIYTDRMGG